MTTVLMFFSSVRSVVENISNSFMPHSLTVLRKMVTFSLFFALLVGSTLYFGMQLGLIASASLR
jgi:hypothetical protein